jgi:protein involved in polysaccharide export with SLBB domain
LLWLVAGCASGKPHVDEAMKAKGIPASHTEAAVERYHVYCPDVLHLRVEGRADLDGLKTVALDGRIDLGNLGRVRVEGQTVGEIAGQLAALTGIPAERVHVGVAEFNSQRIYLIGEGNGLQRAVAYQGPETVHELLRRAGGVTAGAASRDVSVLRARVAEGRAPEVFRVDLEAIVLRNDQQTNLRLEPFDQVFVGETRMSALEKCLPSWLKPLYLAVTGLYRPGGKTP